SSRLESKVHPSSVAALRRVESPKSKVRRQERKEVVSVVWLHGLDLGLWTSDQFLDPMILRIGDIKIARGIEGHTPGIAEAARFGARAANDFNGLAVRVEHLDTAVAELAHILPTGRIDANIVGIA